MDTTALCTKMDELARHTWATLAEAQELGARYGEVAITDSLLLALRRFGRQDRSDFDLQVVATSQAAERRSGADFEIWLQVGTKRYFPYSIQAKRARRASYDSLGHGGDASKGMPFQYDTLLEHAEQHGTVPMHLFYNGWETPPPGVRLANPPDDELYGCAVLATSVVKAIREAGGKAEHRIKAYAPHEVPWSALFRQAVGHGNSGLGAPLNTSDPGAVYELGATFGLDVREAPERLPSYVADALATPGRGRKQLPQDPSLPRFAMIVRDTVVTGRGRKR